MHGMPTSWLVRYHNLSTYFWPQIVDGSNFLVGLRPAARVPAEGAFGFVWIESGYLWLLWGGGLPLLAAFCWFVRTCLKTTGRSARLLATPASVAALATYCGVVSCVVLMIFDPHITYRSSADALLGFWRCRRAEVSLSCQTRDDAKEPLKEIHCETSGIFRRRDWGWSACTPG